MKLELLSHLWQSFEQILNETVIGNLENWSLSIIIDSDNGLLRVEKNSKKNFRKFLKIF